MADGGFISPHVFQQRLAKAGAPVTIDTVWRWCKQKLLDARKVGREWKIREHEVARVLDVGIGGLR